MEIKPTLQDFSLLETRLIKIKDECGLSGDSSAFAYLALDLILKLQEDEIGDAMTDGYYLKSETDKISGHDRGIDAVYIDEEVSPPKIHLFNFKHATTFENTKSFFPSSEIDKMTVFLSKLIGKEQDLINEVNPTLASKINEIWNLYNTNNPEFELHICSNYYFNFEPREKDRFERQLQVYSKFKIKYHLMNDLIDLISKEHQKVIDAKIRAIERNFFEKNNTDVQALVLELDSRDLIRIIIDDDAFRNNADIGDYRLLKDKSILEDAFQSNVRVYLKQRTRINKNIKVTALSEDNYRFFYYNNGITITCDNFSYPKQQKSPIIELKNIQIVNGGQTIHALYDAFNENPDKFESVSVLCRIYKTQDPVLSTTIAEYTNSQNPVKNRDIRSLDYVQIKLEKEFAMKGFFYERKRNQHSDEPKSKRLDSEKVGQVLMSFYNGMPGEAKNHKSFIFGENYEEIFSEDITTDKVLIAYGLFDKIEQSKKQFKERFKQAPTTDFRDTYVLHASYYILYALAQLSKRKNIEISIKNVPKIWSMYDSVLTIIRTITDIQIKKDGLAYLAGPFFKSNLPRRYFEEFMDSEDGKKFLDAVVIPDS